MKVYEKTPAMRVSRFRFIWLDSSLNDNGIKILKFYETQFGYHNQKLYAIRNDNYFPIEYERIKDNLWEMKIFHP